MNFFKGLEFWIVYFYRTISYFTLNNNLCMSLNQFFQWWTIHLRQWFWYPSAVFSKYLLSVWPVAWYGFQTDVFSIFKFIHGPPLAEGPWGNSYMGNISWKPALLLIIIGITWQGELHFKILFLPLRINADLFDGISNWFWKACIFVSAWVEIATTKV